MTPEEVRSVIRDYAQKDLDYPQVRLPAAIHP